MAISIISIHSCEFSAFGELCEKFAECIKAITYSVSGSRISIMLSQLFITFRYYLRHRQTMRNFSRTKWEILVAPGHKV